MSERVIHFYREAVFVCEIGMAESGFNLKSILTFLMKSKAVKIKFSFPY